MVSETIVSFCNAAVKKQDFLKGSVLRYFVLSMLAGIYVGIGIVLIFSVAGPLKGAGSGAFKALMGASFGVALILVIFAQSELFTGNNMVMTIASLCKKVTWMNTIKLWIVCYLGNLAGSLLLAYVIKESGLMDNGAAHDFISNASFAKGSAPFMSLFLRGVLCNLLVCLAVWTTARTKNDAAKIMLIFWCLLAFIGSGYEHSIANMTVIGIGLFVAPEIVTWGHFWANMIPVTLGNMVGGCLLGAAYWYVANQSLNTEKEICQES
jgi:nitrite transporter